jgi:hypothetical protein
MTRRLHAFPRVDVREAPARSSPSGNVQWALDWAEAISRARTVNAIPSAYALPERTPRTAEAARARAERTRRNIAIEDAREVEA